MSDEKNPEKDGKRSPLGLLKATIEAFLEDDVIHWGASLAYYSLISLAPLVVLGMSILGKVVGQGDAEAWIMDQVRLLAGPRGVEIAGGVLKEAGRPELGSVGAILTIALLLFGATAVFTNLQGVLNRIWGVRSNSSILHTVLRTRLAAFFMVLALGGILVVSMILSTALSWAGPIVDPIDSVLPFVRLGEIVTSLLLLWLFVAATFRILPDASVAWRDVWVGGLATAVVLYAGKYALATFLARNAFASMYGTAGSLFLLLMWIYFSAQVYFLGAEFTQIWARQEGRGIHPERHAVRTRIVDVASPGEEGNPKGSQES